MEDRGVRRARYWVLRDAEMPAVLIEGGFMSNPAESKKIYDAGYRRQMAKAIVAGVLAYKAQSGGNPAGKAVSGQETLIRPWICCRHHRRALPPPAVRMVAGQNAHGERKPKYMRAAGAG